MTNIKQGIEASLKSRDTEELLDIYFNRPIGYAWAMLFNKFNVHPNVVTILSIIIGAAAGYMFYYPDMTHTIAGILLLVWANTYDSADGQLARLTGKKTRWGRMLDGFAGDIWFFSIYCFICLRLTPEWGVWIWLMGAAAGLVCHSRQCSLADYYRNIHLYFLKGESGSELDNFKQQREIFHSLPWKHNIWWKLFLYFYGNYTRKQEQMTPHFQQMFASYRASADTAAKAAAAEQFLEGSRPLMKYCNILTFNTRAIALYISVLIGEPWLYFVFELTVLNIILIYMWRKHESLSRNIYSLLTDNNNTVK